MLPRQKSRCCGSKKSEESGRDIVNLGTLLNLKPGSHTRLPTLMRSTSIRHHSKFKCVTWLLLSKAFARTCTLQRSGEAGTVKDLQHHACTVATSISASVQAFFLERLSSAMQVSFRTAANAWPSNHPKKMVALLLE